MAFLVDTNVLVYRFDSRFPEKQRRATQLLREGIRSGEARLSHQAILEFIAAVLRPLRPGRGSILSPEEARREGEDLLKQFPVVYPVEPVVRLAIRGFATYGLNWLDAHRWAYAEHYGFSPLYSEDFQHDRVYGTVHVVNPFAA